MHLTKLIQDIKSLSPSLIHRFKFNYKQDRNILVSIVMTTHDREKQTLFTLQTIEQSKNKDKLEIILVDDSPCKTENFISSLMKFSFPIHYISIDYDKKSWLNPCVNYNIGFNEVQGDIILIQNSEVCHLGDIVTHAILHITEQNYLSFEVCTTLNFPDNERLRVNMTPRDFFDEKIHMWWFQHSTHRNENYHFLTCITFNNLKKLGGFDWDYAQGIWYDDDEFVFRIRYDLKLLITCVNSSESNLLGVHQFHTKNKANTEIAELSNLNLHNLKKNYFQTNNKWISFYKQTVVTITGIRPDFIRMRNVFSELDSKFNHILIHTGQHYDELLSGVFFKELNIRSPDYVLNTGKSSSNHYEQLSYLSTNIIELFQEEKINPSLIIFLGDSNTVLASIVLKKQGYKICHIEAGMRSYDGRMFEEINRKICDNCTDLFFVYHENYKNNLLKENITKNIHVVGNTIVEVCNEFKVNLFKEPKTHDCILMDIHRPENFNDKNRLSKIIHFANQCVERFNLPLFLLQFGRTMNKIKEFNIDLNRIVPINLLSFKDYLKDTYHCRFLISDSGTGQEEPALLNTKVVVPRDFTERPESYDNNCSIKYDMTNEFQVFDWLEKNNDEIKVDWLGNGKTSKLIVNEIINYLSCL